MKPNTYSLWRKWSATYANFVRVCRLSDALAASLSNDINFIDRADAVGEEIERSQAGLYSSLSHRLVRLQQRDNDPWPRRLLGFRYTEGY